MPAPNLATLYQFEGQLDSAFSSVLSASGTPAFFAHTTEEKPADRIEVMAEIGAATDQLATNKEFNTYNFNLTATAYTQRDLDEPLPTRHRWLVGQIRARLSVLNSAANFTSGNLPYLQLLKLVPAGSASDFDNSQDRAQDITRLQYAGQFAIISTAWPA